MKSTCKKINGIAVAFILFSFTLQAQFTTVGTAMSSTPNCYDLTADAFNQIGAVWNNTPINLEDNFTITAVIDLGDIGSNDADGIAFALQQEGPTALGCDGGCIGYIGIPGNKLGVMFKTWVNDELVIWDEGPADISGTPYGLPAVSGPIPITIDWNAVTKTLSVDFNNDGNDIIWTNNILSTIFEGDPIVYWGFTSATSGAFSSAHSVCDIVSEFTEVPPDLQFTLAGSATSGTPNCYDLTADALNQIGAVWNNTPINLEDNFTITAVIDLGDIGSNDADGIAFALQQEGPTALGCDGGCIGYIGIPGNKLGVMFKTWVNDELVIWDEGPADISGTPYGLPAVSGPIPITIDWNAVTKTLSVDFNNDGNDIIWTNNILSTIFEGDPIVYWGFASATSGSFSSAHSVCDIVSEFTVVPTLSQWGVCILGLCMMLLTIIVLKQEQIHLA